jgi:hypothetical protein
MSLAAVLTFVCLFALALTLGLATDWLLLAHLPLGDFRGIALTVFAVLLIYGWAAVEYRLMLRISGLGGGDIVPGSRREFFFHVNTLFYVVLFNSLIRTNFLPTPLMRWVYIALGARLGRNSYAVGALLDPPFIEIGDNSIVGHNAVVFAHIIEGDRIAIAPVRIGSQVTIGAMAVVMPGVTLEDGAILSAGSVAAKGKSIGEGEVWGGVPARLISRSATRTAQP